MSQPESRSAASGDVNPALPDLGADSTLADIIDWFAASGVIEGAMQQGEMIPDFALPDSAGVIVSVQTMLDRGPLIVDFTLGSRSRRCREALVALQSALREITSHGAAVVAITPDPPRLSRALQEAAGLSFALLSDEGGHIAHLFGVAYPPPLPMTAWMQHLQLDEPAAWSRPLVPLTAAYVVTPDGLARMAFVNANPLERVDPRHLVAAARELRASGRSPAGQPATTTGADSGQR